MIGWKERLTRLPGLRGLIRVRIYLLEHWFDWRYHVETCGIEDPHELSTVGENLAHALNYLPTSARSGRKILRDLPVSDVSRYTFIDMGSGKGRMLLLAAELPFRRIIGVEFASELYALTGKNVKTYQNPKQACFKIEPVNMDAAQFEFPPEPLFVYFFFPFERFVMERVIQNLSRSLAENPRDVFLLYFNPVLSDVVEAAGNWKVYKRYSYYFGSPYIIYRSAV